jgi:hypothetical protein
MSSSKIAVSGLAQRGSIFRRETTVDQCVFDGVGLACANSMRTLGLMSIALLFVQCSATNGNSSRSSSLLARQSDAAPSDSGMAPSCSVPANANGFDADSGIGCQPANDSCESAEDGSLTCSSGCAATQYELRCTGKGDSGAALPSADLNCTIQGVPGQIFNLIHYCCSCSPDSE